jgi:V-type H+-transporting ATPase subunit d
MVSPIYRVVKILSNNRPTDLKLQLGPAYGDFLASLPPNPSTSTLASKTTDKLISEFRYLRANAVGSLAKFMDYLTYGYMIDNVALLITGTLHERDTRELLERCHPLGWFETMPVLCVATNIEELYNSVLVETPLAPYFKGSLSHQDLDELNIEIVRNTLYKNYLEDFHSFVNTDPDMANTPTSEVMTEILEFEADRRAINITLNSFGTELSKADRKKLYPSFGRLYPEGSWMLSRAEDIEGVRLAVDGVSDYKTYFDASGMAQGGGIGVGNMSGGAGGDGKSLEDMFYQKEMDISKGAFTRQFTYAIVYAWVKLREQVSLGRRGMKRSNANNCQGDSEHHLDRRVYSTKPERADRQLYQCILASEHILLEFYLVQAGSSQSMVVVVMIGG